MRFKKECRLKSKMMILKYQKVTHVIKNVWLWLVVNTLAMMYNQLPYDVVSNLYQSDFMVREKKKTLSPKIIT